VTIVANLTDACGADPGFVCEWVFDTTDSVRLAQLANWLVERPLRIVLILLVALILERFVRRAIARLIERIAREHDEDLRRASRGDRQWLERFGERSERSRQRTLTLGGVLRNVASVIVFGFAFLLVLGELDINLGPLIAGAGIAGVAIGFGAQSLVRDFFSGMFIVLEDQYGVGDTVNLGEASGTVERISLRTTWVRDLEGTRWVVPNGEIRRVANKSQQWARAVLDLRVALEADLERTMEVARAACAQYYEERRDRRELLEPPEVLGIESFLDSAAIVRIVVRTEPGMQFAVARSLRIALRQAFDAADIKGVTGMSSPPPR
jgi:moderate conductance mechanosensitive channel